MSKVKAVVFAYHNVGVRCLKVLLSHGIEVVWVLTHQDNPQENIWFDSVARTASEYRLPVTMPDNPNQPGVVEKLQALQPDFIFSFYYRHLLGKEILAIPRLGALNMHGSLLPYYRGRAPVNWAVITGARQTGASLHYMVEKPDAGDLVAQTAVPILLNDTAREVFDKVTVAAEITLNQVLPDLCVGVAPRIPLNLAQGSYFSGRRPEDGRIDWKKSAQEIHNLIRGTAPPYPGAFCALPQSAQGQEEVRLSLFRSQQASNFSGRKPGSLGLFIADGEIYALCGDGEVLRIMAGEIEGTPLSVPVLKALRSDQV